MQTHQSEADVDSPALLHNTTTSPLIGAIDQGTSSSRFLIFSSLTGELVTFHQEPVVPIYPQEGWVEQDPNALYQSVLTCIEKAVRNLESLRYSSELIVAVGLTNQRETTVVWDSVTGEPLANAIVWMDSRTSALCESLVKKTKRKSKDQFQFTCGLPLSTYFSALKIRWLLDNVPAVESARANGRLMVGTVDTWLLWKLTKGESYITDLTNASRTMLMNIHSFQWDNTLCGFFGIDQSILPKIVSSSGRHGVIRVPGPMQGVHITGILGDQQAALVGQNCLKSGEAKTTYGTGSFLLCNVGEEPVFSKHGLLTTVAYRFGDNRPVKYALEGSIAIAGAAMNWIRDSLGLFDSDEEVEPLANSVPDTRGCYFVPAFTGLLCPYWSTDARGVIVGLTQAVGKAHLVRAALEAVCFQTEEVLAAMAADTITGGLEVTRLRVDGGMAHNDLLMQMQADITGLPVDRPSMTETTALGAAIAAAYGADLDPSGMVHQIMDTFQPHTSPEERDSRLATWRVAVTRAIGWGSACHSAASNQAVGKVVTSGGGSSSDSAKIAAISSVCLALGVGIGFLIDFVRRR